MLSITGNGARVKCVKLAPITPPVARDTPVRQDPKDVQGRIHLVRGARVILDADLARLYGVRTKRLNEAVSRNLQRFPNDFMFRLTRAEATLLKSQIATSKRGRGGRHRSTPRAFTEQGIAMLSSVLRSPRAVAVNVRDHACVRPTSAAPWRARRPRAADR
ncbi:MAG: ORF6N domain-containing protein [Candidatus Limnocylindria bacterium]